MATIYDVFLCHSSADKQIVEALAQKLLSVNINPFLDIWNLVPGDPWQEGLEDALDQSRTCAVFIGPKGIAPWQNEEMRSALEDRVHNRLRVIPVLLPGARESQVKKLPRFLRRLGWVDFRAGLGDDEAFHRLVSGIQGVPPRPGGGGAPALMPSPQKKWPRRLFPVGLGLLTLSCLVWAWLAWQSHVLLLVPGSGIFDRLAAVDDPPPGPDEFTCSLRVQLGDESYRIPDLRRQPVYLGDPDKLGSEVPKIAGPEWVEAVKAWSGRTLTEGEKTILDVLSSERPFLVRTARLHGGKVKTELTCIRDGHQVLERREDFTIRSGHDVQPIFLAR